jgi:hypothetical protein
MDHQPIEKRIRERAYSLWLSEGAMEGCSDEYWRQAREIVENEMLTERVNGQLANTDCS